MSKKDDLTSEQVSCKCLCTTDNPRDHASHCPVSPGYPNFKLRVKGFKGVSVTGGRVRHFVLIGAPWKALCGKEPRAGSQWHDNNVVGGNTCGKCKELT
jgi:hypothetical protein